MAGLHCLALEVLHRLLWLERFWVQQIEPVEEIEWETQIEPEGLGSPEGMGSPEGRSRIFVQTVERQAVWAQSIEVGPPKAEPLEGGWRLKVLQKLWRVCLRWGVR